MLFPLLFPAQVEQETLRVAYISLALHGWMYCVWKIKAIFNIDVVMNIFSHGTNDNGHSAVDWDILGHFKVQKNDKYLD